MSEQDVPDEELLKDIELTRKEYKAYRDIAFGFQALSELPENQDGHAGMYCFEHIKYIDLYERCYKFYEKLCELAEKRGIL